MMEYDQVAPFAFEGASALERRGSIVVPLMLGSLPARDHLTFGAARSKISDKAVVTFSNEK